MVAHAAKYWRGNMRVMIVMMMSLIRIDSNQWACLLVDENQKPGGCLSIV